MDKMTPEEALEKYNEGWVSLNADKEAAVAKGDTKLAKKCRQMLSSLSDRYSLRFQIGKEDNGEEDSQTCQVCESETRIHL